MDSKFICTNVPFDCGLIAAKLFLDQRLNYNPSAQWILAHIKEVLTSHLFRYGYAFFLQVSGVAMG